LPADRRACFDALSADVRAAARHEQDASDAIESVHEAFASGQVWRWAIAVRMIGRLVGGETQDPISPACVRLRIFVSENADLLGDR
jgi:hypothetical protein